VQLDEDGYLGYTPDRHRSWRPPLYPAFVAAVYRVLGTDPLNVKLVQAALAGLTALLVFRIGRHLHSSAAGIAGALLFAFYGFEIRHGVELVPENLIAFLLAAFAVIGLAEPKVARVLAQAALIGLVLHMQPGLATVAIFWAGFLIARSWSPKGMGHAFLFGVATLACLVPWTIRNHGIHGEIFLVSTNGGFNLMNGNNPEATGYPAPVAYTRSVKAEKPHGLTEVESDRWYRQRGIGWIVANPGSYVGLVLSRLYCWTCPSHLIEPGSGWPLTFGVIMPLAVLGAGVLLRRWNEVGRLLVLIAAAATPSALVVYVGPRYRSPVAPILTVLAGVGLVVLVAGAVALIRRFRRFRRSSTA
jgi:4-amino-4-deoxy-L-arabinose transferase-like glycosyltransferase